MATTIDFVALMKEERAKALAERRLKPRDDGEEKRIEVREACPEDSHAYQSVRILQFPLHPYIQGQNDSALRFFDSDHPLFNTNADVIFLCR